MLSLLSSLHTVDVGLLVLRVGIGTLFLFHGYPKLMGGTSTWLWLGSQLKMFGITVMPVVFVFIAACTEFFGGMALITGYGMSVATALLTIVMIVATLYHLHNGDGFIQYSHALALLVVFIALHLMGPGRYTLQAFFA